MSDLTYSQPEQDIPFYVADNGEAVKVEFGPFEVYFELTSGTRGEVDARYSLRVIDPSGVEDFEESELDAAELFSILTKLAMTAAVFE